MSSSVCRSTVLMYLQKLAWFASHSAIPQRKLQSGGLVCAIAQYNISVAYQTDNAKRQQLQQITSADWPVSLAIYIR